MEQENANQNTQKERKDLHFEIVNEDNLPFKVEESNGLGQFFSDEVEIVEIIDITPDRPILPEINVDLGPVLQVGGKVLKAGTFLGASAGTGYLVFIAVRFILAWFWTPVILMGSGFIIMIFVFTRSSLSGRSLRSQDTPNGRRDRNINITNIVEGGTSSDINITNIIK